jgi:hypothetical protein
MLGYRLPGGVEMLGDGIGCHRLQGYQYNDGPSRRISYSLKDISSHFDGRPFMQPFGCKYMSNQSVSQIYFEAPCSDTVQTVYRHRTPPKDL